MSGRPRFEPGEIVTAMSVGKARPMVLVQPQAGRWKVAAITTRPTSAWSTERVPVPGWNEVGLDCPSFLDHELKVVPDGDVREHVGWATDELVDAVARATGRSPWELEDLRPHARRDRRRRLRAS